MKKNILIISFFYYPDSRVGAKRFGNLVKHFLIRHPNIHILTLSKKHIPQIDRSLEPSGTVHYVPMVPKYPFPRTGQLERLFFRIWEKYLCIIEPFSGWIIPATLKALTIIFRKDIDVIIATGPPFSALIAGVFIQLISRKKLILDYRDPWSNSRKEFPKPFGKLLNSVLEKVAARVASGFVFCSNIMRDDFIYKFGRRENTPYQVLTNGYTPEATTSSKRYLNGSKLNMLYAGSLYHGRSLALVALPLQNLMKGGIIDKENFKFSIFGSIQPKDIQIIDEMGLSEIIEINKPIPYKEILLYMRNADILFLPSAMEVSYAIPYKFFDYLMVRRPIMAVAPSDSSVAYLMREIDCGWFCPIGDNVSVEKAIKLAISGEKAPSFKGAEKFLWPSISLSYSDLIIGLSQS